MFSNFEVGFFLGLPSLSEVKNGTLYESIEGGGGVREGSPLLCTFISKTCFECSLFGVRGKGEVF